MQRAEYLSVCDLHLSCFWRRQVPVHHQWVRTPERECWFLSELEHCMPSLYPVHILTTVYRQRGNPVTVVSWVVFYIVDERGLSFEVLRWNENLPLLEIYVSNLRKHSQKNPMTVASHFHLMLFQFLSSLFCKIYQVSLSFFSHW